MRAPEVSCPVATQQESLCAVLRVMCFDSQRVNNPTLEKLAAAHGFTLEELAENRAGRLTARQTARGLRRRRASVIIFSVLALLAFAGGVGGAALLWDDFTRGFTQPIGRVDRNGLVLLGGGGVVLASLFLWGAVSSARAESRRLAVWRQGRVDVLEGPLKKILRTGQGGTAHMYSLGGITFYVHREAWELVPGGDRFRLYCVARELLSLEPL